MFCNQILAQTNRPIEVGRCSFENYDYEYQEYITLPAGHYPFGVCLRKPWYLDGRETSTEEDVWIYEAIEVWNRGYDNYINRTWGDTINPYPYVVSSYNSGNVNRVVYIPDGPLFKHDTCDSSKRNLIYVTINDLDMGVYGTYQPVDSYWDFLQFYGKIEINKHKTANYKALFINVMIHELGHALGIPHLPPETTHLMRQVNYGCDEYYKNVCQLTDVEFEAFLRPYDPPSLETQRKFKERKKREYEKWERLPYDRCGFKKDEYNQGFDSYDKRYYHCP